MYYLTKLSESKWGCTVTIQDGLEEWVEEGTYDEAIQSLIEAAKALNNDCISKDNICFRDLERKNLQKLSDEELNLIQQVRQGKKCY